MKHKVIITKQDFMNVNYDNGKDCALARALKRAFPKATDIKVEIYGFHIVLNVNRIHRYFTSCELESSHHTSDISNLILDYCYLDFRTKESRKFNEVVFNFITF